MCLVSYIPINQGYLLNSNRDESPLRADTQLVQEKVGNHQLVYPKDIKGGTWICLSDKGTSLCVLNGAFVNHKRILPYRISRGLMVKSYFNYNSTTEFLQNFNFENIEPFTLVIRDQFGLYEFRWDSQYKHISRLDISKSYVWSSCTLYSEEMQAARSELFFESMPEKIDLSAIQTFHLGGDLGDKANNFSMNRDDRVATISHTNVMVNEKHKSIFLNNLITKEYSSSSL